MPAGGSVLHRGVWGGAPALARGFRVNMEPTPNPDSMKFSPEGQVVLPPELGTGMHFSDVKQATNCRLARQLLKLPNISSVFLARDFLSINRSEGGNWQILRPLILGYIMDAYAEGKPIITASTDAPASASASEGEAVSDADKEIISLIQELLETRIRPAVQSDGGDIFFVGWDGDTGVVKVRMAGSCVGCPSSAATLKQGVEGMLMHYVPEVNKIVQVTDDVLTKTNDDAVSELEAKLALAGMPV